MPIIACPICNDLKQSGEPVGRTCEKCGKPMVRVDNPNTEPVEKVSEPEPAEPEAQEAEAEADEQEEKRDFHDLTVKELRELGKEWEVANWWNLPKEELIAAIEKAQE